MKDQTSEILLFKNRDEWRSWLSKNHDKSNGIWMAYYKKHTGKKSIPYDDAVEEALCFGWIDSRVKSIDEEKYMQKYTPRKKRSIWSELNKKRVKKMIKDGRMMEAGLKKINEAIKNGSWDRLDEVNDIKEIPEDFKRALSLNKKAEEFFQSLSPSNKKMYMWWISSAKREETRMKRIRETVKRLSRKVKPGM